jgi:hypothetical protein
MKTYAGMDVQIHILLSSALAGGEWSASSPVRFTTGDRAHGTHWTECCWTPTAGLDDIKILDPTGT